METPVREVYALLGGDNGLEGRATSCARGSAMLEHQTAAHRVLTPLKRVGPRGSGQLAATGGHIDSAPLAKRGWVARVAQDPLEGVTRLAGRSAVTVRVV